MTDLHIRILRQAAHQTQHELDHHDTIDHAGVPASGRRAYLVRAAKRTHARVADAEQRRRDLTRLSG